MGQTLVFYNLAERVHQRVGVVDVVVDGFALFATDDHVVVPQRFEMLRGKGTGDADCLGQLGDVGVPGFVAKAVSRCVSIDTFQLI